MNTVYTHKYISQKLNVSKITRIYNNLCIFHEFNSQSFVRFIWSIYTISFVCFQIFSFCLQVCIISIFYFARKRGKVLGLHLNDLLMSYNLLFNFGLNTCRETNIILLKFKICLISSFQK